MIPGEAATGLMVSVSDLHEMEVARTGGAAIIDLKQPAFGTLGAWSSEALASAMMLWQAWDAQLPILAARPLVSATIGDQPMVPAILREAAERVAASGVQAVRVGFSRSPHTDACIEALAPLAAHCRLIGVLFADREPDFGILGVLSRAGFTGVMIDTADKASGTLVTHLDPLTLGQFIAETRRHGLVTGLAGSLTLEDIPLLARVGADYLGFRAALCGGSCTGRLNAARLHEARIRLKAQSGNAPGA